MMFPLVLMIVSAAVMVAILVHKHVETKRGVVIARVHSVREKADPILRDIHGKTCRGLSCVNFRTFVLLLNFLFVHVVRFFMYVSHKVHRTSADIVARASKKTEDLSRSGAASFYLKQIKEAKESGEIE